MLRVGLYARVSTEEEKQKKSFKRQVVELTDFISSTPGWLLVSTYGDEALSGTETSKRKSYNSMCADIANRKLDIIVIKDSSRLNRNTLEGLKYLKLLNDNGVRLYFHLERKFYDPMNDLEIKIKFVVAEEQSKEQSRKTKAAQKSRMLAGRAQTSGRMWGYEQKDAELLIRDDEADIVKKVFEMYASGYGFKRINAVLMDIIPDEIIMRRKIRSNGIPLTTLKRIIRNEKYKGVLVGNKQSKDFITKNILKNPQEEWIVINDGCPAIVSEDLWQKANDQLDKKRKEYDVDKKLAIAGYFSGTQALSAKIRCALCDSPYWHNNQYSKNIINAWQCGRYKSYGRDLNKGCSAPNIAADLLNGMIKDLIFLYVGNRSSELNRVINVLEKSLEKTSKHDDELRILESKLKDEKTKLIGLEDAFLLGVMTADRVNERKTQLLENIDRLEQRYSDLSKANREKSNSIARLDKIRKNLQHHIDKPEQISDEMVREVVTSIRIYSKSKIDVSLFDNTIHHTDLSL